MYDDLKPLISNDLMTDPNLKLLRSFMWYSKANNVKPDARAKGFNDVSTVLL